MSWCCLRPVIVTTVLCIAAVGCMAQGRPSVAVLDLEALAVPEQEAKTLSAKLRSSLLAAGRYDVVERGRMEEILKEQGFQQSGCVNNACAVEVGQLVGVKYVVAGSIGKVGAVYAFSLRMIDIATGRIIHEVEEHLDGRVEDLLVVTVDKAVSRLALALETDSTGVLSVSKPSLGLNGPDARVGKQRKQRRIGFVTSGVSAVSVLAGVAAYYYALQDYEAADDAKSRLESMAVKSGPTYDALVAENQEMNDAGNLMLTAAGVLGALGAAGLTVGIVLIF